MENKIKIQFLEDRDVIDADGKVSLSFKKDEIHELPEASAQHWLSRHAAVKVEEPQEKAPSTKVGMGKPKTPAKGANMQVRTGDSVNIMVDGKLQRAKITAVNPDGSVNVTLDNGTTRNNIQHASANPAGGWYSRNATEKAATSKDDAAVIDIS